MRLAILQTLRRVVNKHVIAITNALRDQALPKLDRQHGCNQAPIGENRHIDRHIRIVLIPGPAADLVAIRDFVDALIDRCRTTAGDISRRVVEIG